VSDPPWRHHAAVFAALALILAGCLFVAWFSGDGDSRYRSLIVGTLWGQTTLAAIWMVFGREHIALRFLLCMSWLSTISLALVVYRLWLPGLPVSWISHTLVWTSILAQWLLAQVPLQIVRIANEVLIAHIAEDSVAALSKPQFQIRQLLIVTAVVAVVLGLARVLTPPLEFGRFFVHDAMQFLFLVATNVIVTVPLAFCVLSPRRPIAVAIFALLCVTLGSAAEIVLYSITFSGSRSFNAELALILLTKNLTTSAWVVAVLGSLRLGGYRLTSTKSASQGIGQTGRKHAI